MNRQFNSRPRRILPPPRVIAVDVDGTLEINGQPNERLIDWCKSKKAGGFTLILWSSQGEHHARSVALLFNVIDLFDTILSKPGFIVDDKGWSWTRYTQAYHPSLWLSRQSNTKAALEAIG